MNACLLLQDRDPTVTAGLPSTILAKVIAYMEDLERKMAGGLET